MDVHKSKGFTLIELLVVIAIIAILSSVVLSSLTAARRKADDARRDEDMRNMKSALELYGAKYNYDYSPLVDGFTAFALNSDSTHYAETQSRNLFSLTAKTAFAQNYTDPGCQNFKNMADKLIQEDFLKSVPVDPVNNTTGPECYHAYSTINESTGNLIIAGYALKWEKYTKSNVSAYNKKTGFIVSKFGEDDIVSVACQAFNYPAITPSTSSTQGAHCTANPSGYIADNVSGMTSGREEEDTDGGGDSGTCSDPQYTTRQSCEADHSYCSDNSSATEEACLEVGYCSNSTITTRQACQSFGSCSGGTHSDSGTCQAYGDCSNGNTNITDDECSAYNTAGYCSNSSFSSGELTCTSHGYCSNGSDGVTSEECSAMNSGYCSGGSHGTQSECESYGNCSNGNSDVQQSSCVGTYGYCSSGSYDQNICSNYGDCYIPEYGYSYNGVEGQWCSDNGGSFSAYYWVNTGSDSWSPYSFTWNTSYSLTPYIWTAGTTYSWSGYTWNGATWTSTNTWTTVPASTWTSS
jgi:prepilin-type N-terminal cleavage/methylation domain-containing protein